MSIKWERMVFSTDSRKQGARALLSLTLAALLTLSVVMMPYSAHATSGAFAYTTENITEASVGSGIKPGAMPSWTDIDVSADGSYIAATADGGGIYISSDSGESWQKSSASEMPWRDISVSADGQYMVATAVRYYPSAGNRGYIYLSSDYGETWEEQIDAGYANWSSIHISDDASTISATYSNDGAAPGDAYSAIVISRDNGDTWTESMLLYKDVPSYESVWIWGTVKSSSDGGHLVASGGDSVYMSTDYGETWSLAASIGNYRDIAMSSDGMKIVMLDNRTRIPVSSDGGQTWSYSRVYGGNSSEHGWWSVDASADGSQLVMANIFSDPTDEISGLYTSSNGGATWLPDNTIGVGRGWYGVAMSADGSVRAAVSADGSLATSTNYGVDWNEPSYIDTEKQWEAVASSGDGEVVLAATYSGDGLYLSVNGGSDWRFLDSLPSSYGWRLHMSKDGNRMYGVGVGSSIYYSVDRGDTWEIMTPDSGLGITSISASEDGNTIAVVHSRNACELKALISRDAGDTWIDTVLMSCDETAVAGYAPSSVNQVAVSEDGSHIAFAIGGWSVYISSDYGQTWQSRHAPSNEYWHSMAMSGDGSHLYLSAMGPGKVYTTSDSGATWGSLEVHSGARKLSTTTSGRVVGIVAADGRSYVSRDYGRTVALFKAPPGVDSAEVGVMTADLRVLGGGDKLIFAESDGHVYIAQRNLPPLQIESGGKTSVISSTSVLSPQKVSSGRPSFSGMAHPNGEVKVTTYSDRVVCEAVANSAGMWTCRISANLSSGVHKMVVAYTDPNSGAVEILPEYYIQVPARSQQPPTVPSIDLSSPVLSHPHLHIDWGTETSNDAGRAPTAPMPSLEAPTQPEATPDAVGANSVIGSNSVDRSGMFVVAVITIIVLCGAWAAKRLSRSRR